MGLRIHNQSKDVDGLVDRAQVGFRLEMPSTLSNVAFQFKEHDWDTLLYEIHIKRILYCGCRWKWGVIIAVNFQFKQLGGRSLKNIRASTEPVTFSIPVRCSTNRAVKERGQFVEVMSSCAVKWNQRHGFKSRWSPDIFQASSSRGGKRNKACHVSLNKQELPR